MGKLIAIIKREYLERVRTKWFVIATLLGPVLFLALTVLPVLFISRTKASAESGNIQIIDATGAGLGARVVLALHDSSVRKPIIQVVAPDAVAAAEETAAAEVIATTRQGYLVLDSATMRGARAHYAGRNTTTVPDMNRLGRALDKAVLAYRLESAGLDASRIDSLTKVDVRLEKTQFTERGREKSGAGSTILGLLVSFLLYMVLVIYGQTVLRSVIEEKTSRVAEVVISSVRPEILLAGKIIGIGGVAVTQLFAWIASSLWIGSQVVPALLKNKLPAAAAAGADGASRTTDMLSQIPSFSPGLIVALILFFIFGFIFYSTLYAAVGSTVNSESEAQQAATPVVMLLILSAAVIQPVALAPQSTLAVVMSMLPFSAPMMMPMRMSLVSVPLWQIIVSLLGMVAACTVAIWFSARIYRVGLLMYGKRPSFRELLKWLRYS